MANQGACKYCGQERVFDEDQVKGRSQEELDSMASYECECEGAEAHRDVEDNKRFEQFADTEVKEFMEKHGLKGIVVKDARGNKADLLRMEKGDIKVSTTTKKFIA